ncbi:hypothetical protein D1007_18945 [Hordeum vulgare]|nr:hypothetical protein D1007_18945 [Hordeum vulgare]
MDASLLPPVTVEVAHAPSHRADLVAGHVGPAVAGNVGPAVVQASVVPARKRQGNVVLLHPTVPAVKARTPGAKAVVRSRPAAEKVTKAAGVKRKRIRAPPSSSHSIPERDAPAMPFNGVAPPASEVFDEMAGSSWTSATSPMAAKYAWFAHRDLDKPHPFKSHVWHDIAKGIPLFHNTTKVKVGNGASTFFWIDLWVPTNSITLAARFPTLFSHALRPSASVARVFSSTTLRLDLAPWLTHAANLEPRSMRSILAIVFLNMQAPDRRTGRLNGKPLNCKAAYKPMWCGYPVDPLATEIWKNYAPNKCRIFLWLAHKNRLFTNERRFNRGIAASPACLLCR